MKYPTRMRRMFSMGNYGKSINIRLPADLAARFDALAEAIPGLQKGNLTRLLLRSVLDRPLEEQIKIVTELLVSPEHRGGERQHRPRMNSKRYQ